MIAVMGDFRLARRTQDFLSILFDSSTFPIKDKRRRRAPDKRQTTHDTRLRGTRNRNRNRNRRHDGPPVICRLLVSRFRLSVSHRVARALHLSLHLSLSLSLSGQHCIFHISSPSTATATTVPSMGTTTVPVRWDATRRAPTPASPWPPPAPPFPFLAERSISTSRGLVRRTSYVVHPYTVPPLCYLDPAYRVWCPRLPFSKSFGVSKSFLSSVFPNWDLGFLDLGF
jgi:hypothetical protein